MDSDGAAETKCKPTGKQPWNPNGDLCETCKCIIGTEGESKKECEKTECSKCNDVRTFINYILCSIRNDFIKPELAIFFVPSKVLFQIERLRSKYHI